VKTPKHKHAVTKNTTKGTIMKPGHLILYGQWGLPAWSLNVLKRWFAPDICCADRGPLSVSIVPPGLKTVQG